jgi:ribosome-binding factor A
MPKEYPRTVRVGERIRRDLAQIIRDKLDNLRVALVSITDVEISRDLAHARVFVSCLGNSESERESVVAELNHASGFLRHELARGLTMRGVPKLSFRYDGSIGEGSRLSKLITEVVADDEARHQPDDGAIPKEDVD